MGDSTAFDLPKNQAFREVENKKIAVPTRSGFIYLPTQEILYVQADGAYSKIYVEKNEKPFVISKTLIKVQPVLRRFGFVRVHRSYVINVSKVQELNRTDGGFIVLDNGFQVPFSKQYKREALYRIKQMATIL